jgi:sugar transferase (PEP-CTERM/EpsH1 system associated)
VGRKPAAAHAPLIAHIVHRFDIGGLENGVVNLVNSLPVGRYRHAVIALTGCDTDFLRRIHRPDVVCHALNKRPGQDWPMHLRLWRLLRRLRPDIVHTRNLATLECLVAARLSGVRACVHGEHGRDIFDLDGRSRRYRWLRRGLRPLVRHYIALSGELETYLRDTVGVPPARISRITNGVDSLRFHPAFHGREALPAEGFAPPGTLVVGWAGRMEAVKDPHLLLEAFLRLIGCEPALRQRLRLVLIGDGSQRAALEARVRETGASAHVWFAGARDDLPALLRALDIFALPSRAEGISNTILEAMATALPVVATRVGGNTELVMEGETGLLVPTDDVQALGEALAHLAGDAVLRQRCGRAARARIEQAFSLPAMAARYAEVYDAVLERR